ncbi:MAG: hypothetical protein ABIU06_09355 [Anaerolineales bacterium]
MPPGGTGGNLAPPKPLGRENPAPTNMFFPYRDETEELNEGFKRAHSAL